MKRFFAIAGLVSLLGTLTLSLAPASATDAELANPRITEAVKVGQTAELTLADWAGVQSIAFGWLLDGKQIANAKSKTLKITSTMNMKSLQAVQTAVLNGSNVARYSNKIVIGKTSIQASVGFVPGSKSSVQLAELKTFPTSGKVTYQWYRNGQAIKGAVSRTFKLAEKDYYARLTVAVSAQATGFAANRYVTPAFVPDDQPKNYSLLWSDEFNGSSVDLSKWVFQEGDGTAFKNAGWGNNEEQWYLGSQAKFKGDGNLSIEATRTGAPSYKCYYGACTWISSKLVTYKKVGFQYGRFEARIKSSQGQGVWPAFWLLGANIDTRLWPGCGEIDIMELKGADRDTLWGTIHGPNGDVGTTKVMVSDISQWHTYTIDWQPNSITWLVDGVVYQRVTKWDYVGSSSPLVWVFDHEFYIILNLAMGGNFVGGPSDPAISNANLDIDYVRFYSIDGVGQVIQH